MSELRQNVNTLIASGHKLVHENSLKEKDKVSLLNDISKMNKTITDLNIELNSVVEACNLLTKLADTRVKKGLDFIVKIINDTLIKLFPEDFKALKVDMDAYHETYPQMRLTLITSKDKVRSLKTQEGNGVSQVISLLYILCLLYISGYRRFIHIDEVLNGLHPDAWALIDDILKLFEDKLGYQFIITQHGYTPKNGRVIVLKKGNTGMTCVDSIYEIENGIKTPVLV